MPPKVLFKFLLFFLCWLSLGQSEEPTQRQAIIKKSTILYDIQTNLPYQVPQDFYALIDSQSDLDNFLYVLNHQKERAYLIHAKDFIDLNKVVDIKTKPDEFTFYDAPKLDEVETHLPLESHFTLAAENFSRDLLSRYLTTPLDSMSKGLKFEHTSYLNWDFFTKPGLNIYYALGNSKNIQGQTIDYSRWAIGANFKVTRGWIFDESLYPWFSYNRIVQLSLKAPGEILNLSGNEVRLGIERVTENNWGKMNWGFSVSSFWLASRSAEQKVQFKSARPEQGLSLALYVSMALGWKL